jgi:hypothetical protein
MPEHKDIEVEHSHKAHAFAYADEAARLAASGFVASDVDKLAIQKSDWSIWILTSTSPTWEPACKKAVFGTDLNYNFEPSEVSTTSTTPVSVISSSVNASATGYYRIGFSTSWRGSSTSYDVRIHLYVDGTNVLSWNTEPKDTNSYHPVAQHYVTNLTAGFHTISIRLSAESGTARLKNTSLEFWRLT